MNIGLPPLPPPNPLSHVDLVATPSPAVRGDEVLHEETSVRAAKRATGHYFFVGPNAGRVTMEVKVVPSNFTKDSSS